MKHVLIIDDHAEIREFMKDLCEYLGYRATVSSSGEEAQSIMENEELDIAFIDICLPGIDGVETMKTLKTTHPDATYVLMSGFPAEERLEEGFRQGAAKFFKKPFQVSDILEILRR
jgi:DNA-binding NtrC family response regulator